MAQQSRSISRSTTEIRPQDGPQERFLSTSADIAIYGGAAGGGKTYALLLETLRHSRVRDFHAVIFRRNATHVTNPGGLWDASIKLYPLARGEPVRHRLEWNFSSSARVKFAHLEYDSTVLEWQGSEVPLICFDELTHFTRAQFFYMLSRNRTTCGVRPYIRATTNPDADSWVAELIAWWLDAETGQPILERAGHIRWFARVNDILVWADSADDIRQAYPGAEPKSLTFIPARLEDNLKLMQTDPGYRANLLALPRVDRERLLGGNWKIKPAAGLLFRREWCKVVDAIPAGTRFVRGWDLASTPKTESNNPDWTCGTKIGRSPDGRFIVAHHLRLRAGPMDIERAVVNTASADTVSTLISIPEDPGQAGKGQAAYYAKALAGYDVRFKRVNGAKEVRFGPFSAQAEAGNVSVLRGDWNEAWFTELEAFPDGAHDDDADSTAEAFDRLLQGIGPDLSGLVIDLDTFKRDNPWRMT